MRHKHVEKLSGEGSPTMSFKANKNDTVRISYNRTVSRAEAAELYRRYASKYLRRAKNFEKMAEQMELDAVEEVVDLSDDWKISGQPVPGFQEAMNAEVES